MIMNADQEIRIAVSGDQRFILMQLPPGPADHPKSMPRFGTVNDKRYRALVSNLNFKITQRIRLTILQFQSGLQRSAR